MDEFSATPFTNASSKRQDATAFDTSEQWPDPDPESLSLATSLPAPGHPEPIPGGDGESNAMVARHESEPSPESHLETTLEEDSPHEVDDAPFGEAFQLEHSGWGPIPLGDPQGEDGAIDDAPEGEPAATSQEMRTEAIEAREDHAPPPLPGNAGDKESAGGNDGTPGSGEVEDPIEQGLPLIPKAEAIPITATGSFAVPSARTVDLGALVPSSAASSSSSEKGRRTGEAGSLETESAREPSASRADAEGDRRAAVDEGRSEERRFNPGEGPGEHSAAKSTAPITRASPRPSLDADSKEALQRMAREAVARRRSTASPEGMRQGARRWNEDPPENWTDTGPLNRWLATLALLAIAGTAGYLAAGINKKAPEPVPSSRVVERTTADDASLASPSQEEDAQGTPSLDGPARED